jgi:hypothetical protein
MRQEHLPLELDTCVAVAACEKCSGVHNHKPGFLYYYLFDFIHHVSSESWILKVTMFQRMDLPLSSDKKGWERHLFCWSSTLSYSQIQQTRCFCHLLLPEDEGKSIVQDVVTSTVFQCLWILRQVIGKSKWKEVNNITTPNTFREEQDFFAEYMEQQKMALHCIVFTVLFYCRNIAHKVVGSVMHFTVQILKNCAVCYLVMPFQLHKLCIEMRWEGE